MVTAGDVYLAHWHINRTQTMRMDIKLSCIAQPKKPTLNIADNTYVLFKHDVLRTSAQTSCDIEVSDGLYSMVVGYGEAVSTSYIYVNNGTAVSVDMPTYILNHKPTNEVPDCTDDLVVKAFNMVNNRTYVQPHTL